MACWNLAGPPPAVTLHSMYLLVMFRDCNQSLPFRSFKHQVATTATQKHQGLLRSEVSGRSCAYIMINSPSDRFCPAAFRSEHPHVNQQAQTGVYGGPSVVSSSEESRQQTSQDSAVLTASGQAARLPRLRPHRPSVQIPATNQRHKSQLPVHQTFEHTAKMFNHIENVET